MRKKKRTIDKEKADKNFKVTIFGSSRIKEGDPTYKQIEKLAHMIGRKNMDLVTGGGPGLMQAASKGHMKGSKGKKIHTIGLAIRLYHEQRPNKYLNVVKNFSRFSNRLDNFMILSDAIVVAPGGIGTLLELFYSWQLIQVRQTCNIPIILLGNQWKDLMSWMKKYPLKNKLLDKKDLDLLFFVKNCDEAMEIINIASELHEKGGENFCLNYKKYKLK